MFSHWNLFRLVLIHREFVQNGAFNLESTPMDGRLVESIKKQMGFCKRLQKPWYEVVCDYVLSQDKFNWEGYVISRAFTKRDQIANETRQIMDFWFHGKELPENLREFLGKTPTKPSAKKKK